MKSFSIHTLDSLFVDELLLGQLVAVDALWKPQRNFSFGRLNRVRSMANANKIARLESIFNLVDAKTLSDLLAANMDGIVTADGARKRRSRVGLAKHDATSLDGTKALPDHAY